MTPEDFKLFNAPIKHYEFGGKTRKRYNADKIPDVFEFHGGCTYYSKDRDIFLGYFILKIGCDYNHYQDEQQQYQLQDILYDVKKSIDSFLSRYQYKRWCGNCGGVFNSSDGVIKEPDEDTYAFKCNKCLQEQNEKKELTTNEKGVQ